MDEVLAREGFGPIGGNAVAKQAGVDTVLIYRSFGGLAELPEAGCKSGRLWPGVDEVGGADVHAVLAPPLAERHAPLVDRFVDSQRARPLTIELLATGLAGRNARRPRSSRSSADTGVRRSAGCSARRCSRAGPGFAGSRWCSSRAPSACCCARAGSPSSAASASPATPGGRR
jgi:hypothetical protein